MTRSSPSQTQLLLHKPQPFFFTTLSPSSPSQTSALLLHNPQPSFFFTNQASSSQASTLFLHNPQPRLSFTNLSPSPSQASAQLLLHKLLSQKFLDKLLSPKNPPQTCQPKSSLTNFSAQKFLDKLLSPRVHQQTSQHKKSLKNLPASFTNFFNKAKPPSAKCHGGWRTMVTWKILLTMGQKISGPTKQRQKKNLSLLHNFFIKAKNPPV